MGAGQRLKALFRTMVQQTLELQEMLKYCSPLGPVLRSLRRMRAGQVGQSVGHQTIKRLEEAGIRSFSDLVGLKLGDLTKLGIRRDLAKQIVTYVRVRME